MVSGSECSGGECSSKPLSVGVSGPTWQYDELGGSV